MAVVGLRNLCKPSMVYLVMSMVAIMFMVSQQYYSNTNVFCMGSYSCNISGGVYLILVVKLLYVLFWTWILNIICRKVSTSLAWVLVLFPYVLWFLLLFYMFIYVK